MTTKQRVMISSLIQKIDNQNNYARQIGVSYSLTKAEHPTIIEAKNKEEKHY